MPYQWETGPFHLLQTPKYVHLKSQHAKPTDSIPGNIEIGTLMTLVHNTLLRAFNAIYQTAPHVPPTEYANFLGYSMNVYRTVKTHHDGEEFYFFPLVEELTGEKGLMDGNVAQHHKFEAGMEDFAAYLTEKMQPANTASFSAVRFRELIDSFVEPLQTHLEEEISTLLALEKYPLLDCMKLQERAHKETLAHLDVAQMRDEMPVLMLNHDPTYEEGMHAAFPEMPWAMKIVLTKGVTWWHAGYWKFAACDASMRPKEVPYVATATG